MGVGATTVFVAGLLGEATVAALVAGIGWNRISVIGVPGSLPPANLQELGASRFSYGPWTQCVALTALADAVAGLLAAACCLSGRGRSTMAHVRNGCLVMDPLRLGRPAERSPRLAGGMR